jgi:hypothetical protein
MFGLFDKHKDDFASVPLNTEVKGIIIPVIPLEKYPEIVIRVSSLIEKIGLELSKKDEKSLDQIMENIVITDLIKYIPLVIRIAADEFFDFAAFILTIEKDQVKQLGLVDLVKIINRVYEVNQLAEVQEEIKNFTKALKNQGKK